MPGRRNRSINSHRMLLISPVVFAHHLMFIGALPVIVMFRNVMFVTTPWQPESGMLPIDAP